MVGSENAMETNLMAKWQFIQLSHVDLSWSFKWEALSPSCYYPTELHKGQIQKVETNYYGGESDAVNDFSDLSVVVCW